MSTTPTKKQVTAVLKKVRKHKGAGQEMMDCFVDDEFARQASLINNEGLRGQVEYLLANGYDAESLTEQLER